MPAQPIRITPPSASLNSAHSVEVSSSARCNQLMGASSTLLCSANEASASNLLARGWGYLKSSLETIYQWIIYLFKSCSCLCQFGPSRIEIIEEIIDEPTKTGTKFAENPVSSIAPVVLALLEDPTGCDSLCQDHRDKILEFIKSFIENTETDLFFYSDKLLPALNKIFNPWAEIIETNDLYSALSELMKKHPETLKQTVKGACIRVANSIPSTSKGFPAILRALFLQLPKVFNQLNDEDTVSLLSLRNPAHLHAFIKGKIPEKLENKEAFEHTLDACFGENSLLFKQLQDKVMAKEVLKLPSPIDLREALAASFLAVATKEQLVELGKILEPISPLASKVAEQLSQIADDRERMRTISNNFSIALPLLKKLYGDYLNPV